ncbi:MAG: hypothetical protein RL329_2033 [Bacteroidota bacterium]
MNNTASDVGGAIYMRQQLSMGNSTLFGNTATNDAGSIYNWDGAATIQNTIIWGNTGGAPTTLTRTGANATLTIIHSDIQGTGVFTGMNNINQNPLRV